MRCGITSKAVSFWLRFVATNEREQFNSLLCEADEESKNGRPDSFARLLLYDFNVCKPSPVTGIPRGGRR